MSEKRQHERRPDVQGTFCYVDGVRFDARTLDVSAGGAFIATTDDIPVGMTIVLVFEREARAGRPTHLVGRVVRAQAVPVAGIGIEWLRAVSTHSEAELMQFPTGTLGLRLDSRRAPLRRVGTSLHYDFKFGPAPVSLPRALPPMARTPPGAGATQEDLDEVYSVPSEQPKSGRAAVPDRVPAWQRGGAAGPITRVIQTDVRVAVDLPARLTVGRTTCQVQVRALGTQSVAITADVAPIDASTPLSLLLAIPTSGGNVGVKVTTRWRSRSADGIAELQVVAIDDSVSPGVYERYIKLLRCREVAGG